MQWKCFVQGMNDLVNQNKKCKFSLITFRLMPGFCHYMDIMLDIVQC